jgi:prepilin-type N-terminal cleavage/methylation domain-containing protein
MRKSPISAFTLLEMLTVLAIIVIIAGLVLAVGGYVQKKGALSRAAGEIAMLESACESYKSDNGSYPRDTSTNSVTDLMYPKQYFSPTINSTQYTASSLFLYKQLTGDFSANGVPSAGVPTYLKEYDPRILNATRDPSTKAIIQVNNLQDPFGFPYAYSTAAAADEQTFQKNLLINPGAVNTQQRLTGSALHGFNVGSYDLWSTGGSNATSNPTSPPAQALEWAKWVKNW